MLYRDGKVVQTRNFAPYGQFSKEVQQVVFCGWVAEPEAVSLGSLDHNELLVWNGWLVVLRGRGLVVGPGGTNNIPFIV